MAPERIGPMHLFVRRRQWWHRARRVSKLKWLSHDGRLRVILTPTTVNSTPSTRHFPVGENPEELGGRLGSALQLNGVPMRPRVTATRTALDSRRHGNDDVARKRPCVRSSPVDTTVTAASEFGYLQPGPDGADGAVLRISMENRKRLKYDK